MTSTSDGQITPLCLDFVWVRFRSSLKYSSDLTIYSVGRTLLPPPELCDGLPTKRVASWLHLSPPLRIFPWLLQEQCLPAGTSLPHLESCKLTMLNRTPSDWWLPSPPVFTIWLGDYHHNPHQPPCFQRFKQPPQQWRQRTWSTWTSPLWFLQEIPRTYSLSIWVHQAYPAFSPTT